MALFRRCPNCHRIKIGHCVAPITCDGLPVFRTPEYLISELATAERPRRGSVVAGAAEHVGGVRQKFGNGVEGLDGALGATWEIDDERAGAHADHGA